MIEALMVNPNAEDRAEAEASLSRLLSAACS